MSKVTIYEIVKQLHDCAKEIPPHKRHSFLAEALALRIIMDGIAPPEGMGEQEFSPIQLFLNGKGDGNYCNGEFSFTFNNGKLTRFMWGSIEIPLAPQQGEYVPMSDWYKIKIAETKNGLKIELINYLESEVVRRMKEQGLI